ncbi:MAG: hypothetical protein M3Q76_06895 [Acidobacteriota bacterium]|nr:hypothetical protein [Acidobacteriota bacterium]
MEKKHHNQGAPSSSPPPPAKLAVKKSRQLRGFLIAGASLAALFGLAALKGRVKDNIKEEEQ